MGENNFVHDLFVRGIAAAKAKEYAEAQHLLERVLGLDPTSEQRVDALVWLAQIATEKHEKRKWVEEALANNPADMRARRILAILNNQITHEQIVDPDQIIKPEASVEPQAAHFDRFVCPQCGGRMSFTPDGNSLTCEYCEVRGSGLRAQTVTQASAAENFLITMMTKKGHLHPVNAQVLSCQGCASNFILNAQVLSATCPYCGSNYVASNSKPTEQIRPHLIFPFQIGHAKAVDNIQNWFLKTGLTTQIFQIEQGVGIYLPVWSFEMAGQVPWNGLVEDGHNHWVPQNGIEIVYHYSVLVPAGTHLLPECEVELQNFDIKQAEPFDESFLANWPAETYSVSLGNASLEARRRTFEFEKQSVIDRLMQPIQDLKFSSTGISIESFRLVLTPMWLFHYHIKGERYQVIQNGITGKISGQKPLNWFERLLKGK